MTWKQGAQLTYPWGTETVIHLLDGEAVVRSVVVGGWPTDKATQETRAAKLIANYEDDVADVSKPSETLNRAELEALLIAKGLLAAGEHVENIKAKDEPLAVIRG